MPLSMMKRTNGVGMPQFSSEPKFEPELMGTGPKFGPKFRPMARPNLKSSSAFGQGPRLMNVFGPVWTYQCMYMFAQPEQNHVRPPSLLPLSDSLLPLLSFILCNVWLDLTVHQVWHHCLLSPQGLSCCLLSYWLDVDPCNTSADPHYASAHPIMCWPPTSPSPLLCIGWPL